MNAPVIADAEPAAAAPAWRPAVLPIGLGLLFLGLAFNQEVASAVQTWIASTAYNHCFLVIPIAAFLLWERRFELSDIAPEPTLRYALLGIPVAAVWLLAERLGIMEGRQLAALSFAELLFLAVLGRRLWWAASGPLLYLYFLVPFGEFLTPKLQDITTWFIRWGTDVLGIPAYIDGYVIEIPQGTFFVAEACAGLRFLIASIAFGCLYALMMYRSPVRRGVFILASMIVPIVANGFRGLGIVSLGYLLGSAQAAATDHILYGWIFFSLVILMLIALGLPFREDGMPASPLQPGPVPRRVRMGSAYACVSAIVALGALSPLATAGLAMAGTEVASVPSRIELGPDCVIQPSNLTAAVNGPVRTQRVVCDGVAMDMMWEAFSPRVTAGPVMAERRRMNKRVESESLSESWMQSPADAGRPWRIMQADDPAYALATAIWIDGRPVRPGMAMRIKMAMNSLFGTGHAPMIMTVVPAVSWDKLSLPDQKVVVDRLKGFLHDHPGLDAAVGATSALK